MYIAYSFHISRTQFRITDFKLNEKKKNKLNENENIEIHGVPPEFWSLLSSAHPPEITHMVTD